MQIKKESGFSLIELLLVVVIVGIISTIAIPYFRKAIAAADNGSTFASMRVIISSEVSFYAQNNRFGRLNELTSSYQNGLGTISGTSLTRGNFTYVMSPDPAPTDVDLRSGYTVVATKPASSSDPGYQLTCDQSGRIY